MGLRGIGGCYKYFAALPLFQHQMITGLITDNLCRYIGSSQTLEVQRTDNICSNGKFPREHQVRSTVIFDKHPGEDEYDGAKHLWGIMVALYATVYDILLFLD